jgi:hypothetical protein
MRIIVMGELIKKPTIIFFQWDHERLPEFLRMHASQQVKCLSHFFNVIVINKDCDYKLVCELYKPDLTLFESGYKSTISKKIKIKNTSAYPNIPKLGLHNGDGWCECRVAFIADMELWGIKTFFSISITAGEYTPEIADQLFVWPNFIDADVYRDYGLPKLIPVMFNGSMISLYPWREKIYNTVSKSFPVLSFPHLGYDSHSPIMIHGVQYAKTINASSFVPACGTITNEIVRKHFEIPGCNSCLITQESPALVEAGFVDMENCIFVDESNVSEKLRYLFNNKDKLESITKAGCKLVHSCHTLKNRDQIFQWFKLYKRLRHDEHIVQLSPFGRLKVVKSSSGIKNAHIHSNGLYIVLLHQGEEKLVLKQYHEAEQLFLKCLSYISWMSEPKVRLTICSLFKGDAKAALKWVQEPLQNTLGNYNSLEPDPIEWAYLLTSLLCNGNLKECAIRASQFQTLHHPYLDHMRAIVRYLTYGSLNVNQEDYRIKTRFSIHNLPVQTEKEWLDDLCIMLKNCNQVKYYNLVSNLKLGNFQEIEINLNYRSNLKAKIAGRFLSIRISYLENVNNLFNAMNIPTRKTGLPSVNSIDLIFRLARYLKLNMVKTAKLLKSYSQLRKNKGLHAS